MTLQNASGLIWLLPLGVVIVALYLLKMRRKDLAIPATFLWPDKVEEIRANALFQKLRPNLLLLLQILALLAIVAAFARPQTMQIGLSGKVTVVVLDSSASMRATDVLPSRFDEAKKLVREAIDSQHPGDRLALIDAGPTPRVVFALGNDPAKQTQALSALEASDSEGTVGEALRLAASLVGSVDGARIVLLSDGDFPAVDNFAHGHAALVYKAIGEYDDNLAISALSVGETNQGRLLFCAVKNFGSKPIDGKLSLYADGSAIDSFKVPAVAPGTQWGQSIAAPAGAKTFEAKLEASDVIKSDNYAATVSDPGAALHVLLVGKGDPFLERALALDPRVTLDRAAQVPTLGQTYDIVIFDGVQEEPVDARGVMTFGAPSSIVKISGSVAKPAFVDSTDAPLMKSVDLRGVYIDSQEKIEPVGTGVVVSNSSAGPLIVQSESRGKREIFVAFEPLDSDFPLQVAFPIFIANALDYLGASNSRVALAVSTGRPFAVPWKGQATLKLPDGSTRSLNSIGDSLIVRDTNRVGKYLLTMGKADRPVYATLRSDRESDIKPVKNLLLGGGTVKSVETPLRFADFWKPLALLALLILGVEWWVFARLS